MKLKTSVKRGGWCICLVNLQALNCFLKQAQKLNSHCLSTDFKIKSDLDCTLTKLIASIRMPNNI